MRIRRIAIALVCLVVAAGVAYHFWWPGAPSAQQQVTATKGKGKGKGKG